MANADTSVTYRRGLTFVGTNTFFYTISDDRGADGRGGTVTAAVTVAVAIGSVGLWED